MAFCVVKVLCYGNRDPNSYLLSNNLEDTLLEPGVEVSGSFQDVSPLFDNKRGEKK